MLVLHGMNPPGTTVAQESTNQKNIEKSISIHYFYRWTTVVRWAIAEIFPPSDEWRRSRMEKSALTRPPDTPRPFDFCSS